MVECGSRFRLGAFLECESDPEPVPLPESRLESVVRT